MFLKLRLSVIARYSDAIDYKQYEGQIQKLIDKHISTDEVKVITELVNIFDKDLFQQEVENTIGERAKADKIVSRTSKYISEKMADDPAFYKKFSEMLKDAIKEHEAQRVSDAEHLKKVKEIMDAVLTRTESDLPKELENKDVAKAFYGLALEALKEKVQDATVLRAVGTQTALCIDTIIAEAVLDNGKPVVDWASPKSNILGSLQIEIGDYLIDEVRDKYNIPLSFGDMDALAERCIEVAKVRYR